MPARSGIVATKSASASVTLPRHTGSQPLYSLPRQSVAQFPESKSWPEGLRFCTREAGCKQRIRDLSRTNAGNSPEKREHFRLASGCNKAHSARRRRGVYPMAGVGVARRGAGGRRPELPPIRTGAPGNLNWREKSCPTGPYHATGCRVQRSFGPYPAAVEVSSHP